MLKRGSVQVGKCESVEAWKRESVDAGKCGSVKALKCESAKAWLRRTETWKSGNREAWKCGGATAWKHGNGTSEAFRTQENVAVDCYSYPPLSFLLPLIPTPPKPLLPNVEVQDRGSMEAQTLSRV